ncbi:MAG: hypothetical protein R3F61_21730 [Myxococcota bacterium]
MLFALIPAALAGFYHPAEVAAQSEAFGKASERSAAAASDAQSGVRAHAEALRRFEEALDLLGSREPAGQRDRHAALEKRYNRDFAALQAFADAMVQDFDGAFGRALERALAAHPGAVRCQGQIPSGPRLPGIPQRTTANPECQGDDLNAALAASMDADPTLASDLAGVLARPWPALGLDAEPVAPVGGERWVSVSEVFHAGMRDALRSIDQADEDARLPFEAAIEQGADKEALRGMSDAAKKVDEATRARRAALASPVLDRADVVLAKQAPPGGWCAQPALLGGCTGTEDTSLVRVLLDDKKIAKSVR